MMELIAQDTAVYCLIPLCKMGEVAAEIAQDTVVYCLTPWRKTGEVAAVN